LLVEVAAEINFPGFWLFTKYSRDGTPTPELGAAEEYVTASLGGVAL